MHVFCWPVATCLPTLLNRTSAGFVDLDEKEQWDEPIADLTRSYGIARGSETDFYGLEAA
jgi:hypothetical protein